ncbi:MAG: transglutaminase domain-containing protein [Candidatus Bathyarchaeota archaeon]|nr:transglutaminase domain-containing protein [Candidatus Bathyarchaeota archaeon]
MRANKAIPLFLILILLMQIVSAQAATQYKYTITYTFENKGATAITLKRDDVAVPLFINSQSQTVTVTSSSPSLGPTYTDEDGNPLAEPNLSLTIPANSKLTYTVIFQITSSGMAKPQFDASKAGVISDIPTALVSEYTITTETFWSNNTEIAKIAKDITHKETTVLGKLTRLVKWFRANVTYLSHEIPLYPDKTLTQRQGDCDDQSILLISMLRSLDIPAYLEIGAVLSSNIDSTDTVWDGHLAISEKGIGWHGWAMVYTPPWGWIPVDLTLTNYDDPMQTIQNAPQYTPTVVTALKIHKQVYTTLSVETRQRIVSSNIYVTSTEIAGGIQASWIDPTMIFLAITLVGAIILMFYTSRRLRKKPI